MADEKYLTFREHTQICDEKHAEIMAKLGTIEDRLDIRNCKDAETAGLNKGYEKAVGEQRSAHKRNIAYIGAIIVVLEFLMQLIKYFVK